MTKEHLRELIQFSNDEKLILNAFKTLTNRKFNSSITVFCPCRSITGLDCLDRSGNANNMTLTGASLVSAFGGKGLIFDNIDDQASITDAASFNNIFNAGGTMIWQMRLNVISDNDGIFRKSAAMSVWIDAPSGGAVKLLLQITFSGNTPRWSTATQVLKPHKKYTCAISYDGSSTANDPVFAINGKIYKTSDGTLNETLVPSGTITNDSGSDLIINNVLADRADMYFRNLMILDRVCTEAQLKLLTGGGVF